MQNTELAGSFVGLSALDATLTKVAVVNGGYELNPVMRHMLEQPEWIFWALKLGGAVVCALVLLLLARRFPCPIKRIFTLLTAIMLGVCLFNLVGVAI